MVNLLVCDEGFEEIVASTIENVTKIEPTVIFFEEGDLAKLSYKNQSAIKIISGVETFSVDKDFELTKTEVAKFADNINSTIGKYKKGIIKITCVRKGDHHFRSIDIAKFFSGLIEGKKSYKEHDIEVLIYIKNDKGYVGIDYSGRNLTKRDYKIFMGSETLRGTIAYNLLLFADVKETDVILDPFMGSGTIPIEAGLKFTNTSPHMFSKDKFLFNKFEEKDWDAWFKEQDSRRNFNTYSIHGFDSMLKFLKYTQKNAKIADINKSLKISKTSIDWLDTKIEEKSVDKIITHPPYLTEKGSKTKINKIYADLFKQAELLLKKEGTITIITNKHSAEYLKNAADKFKCSKELKVCEGQQEMALLQFTW